MNLDIKDLDVDTSAVEKFDSVRISNKNFKNKNFVVAAFLVLLFLSLAIYSYKALESLQSGGYATHHFGVESGFGVTYPILAMSAIIVVICLRGIDGWTLTISKIIKRLFIGLIISIIGFSSGIVSYLSIDSQKESRRKYAETLATIDESLKAEKALKDYITDYPEDPYGMLDLASLYWNNGKRDQSLVIFEAFEENFPSHRTYKIGEYCDDKINSIALKELKELHSFIHKCEIPEGFYEDTVRFERLCRIRPLGYDSEINEVEIPESLTELSMARWRESYVLRSFASWLDTSDNNYAIESAFHLDHDVKTLKEFRVVAVSWAQACRRNNMPEASQEADQLISDIDKRCKIEMKELEEK
jgi:hypothetical protein